MILNKDKWLANFLDNESSLYRHLNLVSLNDEEMSLGTVEWGVGNRYEVIVYYFLENCPGEEHLLYTSRKSMLESDPAASHDILRRP
jgi:hypothetical protein